MLCLTIETDKPQIRYIIRKSTLLTHTNKTWKRNSYPNRNLSSTPMVQCSIFICFLNSSPTVLYS